MALPSMAPSPPGMLLPQHRCQGRAQVCVHSSQGFSPSLCLPLWRNYALSSAQGLCSFPSLLIFSHASLDFPKKSPCPTTLRCCPSLVPAVASQGKPAGLRKHESDPIWGVKCFTLPILPCLQLACTVQQWLPGARDHAPAPVALAPFPWRRELTHWEGGAQGEACGSWGGLFTALETRAVLFQGCSSVWERSPCPLPGAGAP